MKRILMLPMIIFGLITGCTTQSKMASSSPTTLRSDTSKAEMLGLSLDDLQILEEYSPKVLYKIEKSQPISITDVVKMFEAGITPDAMILIINHTKSKFNLTTSDVIRLQMEGVPYKVINFMIRT